MFREISKLVIYREFEEDSILLNLASVFEDYEKKAVSNENLITRIYEEIHKLLDIATQYGFDKNLWHNYLTFLLITNENPFSITCEKVGASIGKTVNHFAKGDFKIFKKLFDFSFEQIEKDLEIDCFTTICHYEAV